MLDLSKCPIGVPARWPKTSNSKEHSMSWRRLVLRASCENDMIPSAEKSNYD